jgi:uncharacterized protein YhaN
MTVEELIAEAACVDADLVPSLLQESRVKIQELEDSLQTLSSQIGGLKTKLQLMKGAASAAEAAEEAEEILSQLRSETEEYIRLRLARAILSQTMDKYRKKNQGPLMTRAMEMFRALTCDSFTGLVAEYDATDRQVLVGVRSSGEKVPVEGMSDGSRDQLFLALRLASLEKKMREREPFPIVLDDILINFDDRRASAALRLLAKLAAHTQILLFTHHDRLRVLAEENIMPDCLRVHSLHRQI